MSEANYYLAQIISRPPKFSMNKTQKMLYMAHVSFLVDQLSACLLALFHTVVHQNLTLNYLQFPEHSL